MAQLVYAAICSLDGYVEDSTGAFDWAAPDEEVHRAVNQLERPIGTYLYGRRMYETMRYWQDATSRDETDVAAEYAAIWRGSEKIVFSTTLTAASTPRTTIEPVFDPDRIRALKMASERDLSIGGAELAGAALEAGLVDVCHLYVVPVTVGGGKPVFPAGRRDSLELVDVRRFRAGTLHLHYRVLSRSP
ncbi:MAG TPA: dihydrofolate reductase family protein [Mycobacteriales bacterium]|jgi:dihydrofolate reductase|nr:dihydrofolate reductase family protein [Mycobacteriales bacterium]